MPASKQAKRAPLQTGMNKQISKQLIKIHSQLNLTNFVLRTIIIVIWANICMINETKETIFFLYINYTFDKISQ